MTSIPKKRGIGDFDLSMGARGRPGTTVVFAFYGGPPKFDSSARNLLILIGHVSVEVTGLPEACRDGVKS